MRNQAIFITGAASGLGRAIALRYAEAGWKICIGDIHDERGKETVQLVQKAGGTAFYVHCDVTKEEHLEKAANQIQTQWGRIDVVVNNAGIAGSAGKIDDISMRDWQWVLDINLLGVVRGSKVFTPFFKKQGYGHFVNIASMAGLMSAPLMSSYNVAKAGVISLSETMLGELSPYGINTTVVCPSFFQTNLSESFRSSEPGMEIAIKKLLSRSKITADDVANNIYQAVQKKKFWVLPHRDGHIAWIIKRYLPLAHQRIMKKEVMKLFRKFGHQKDHTTTRGSYEHVRSSH